MEDDVGRRRPSDEDIALAGTLLASSFNGESAEVLISPNDAAGARSPPRALSDSLNILAASPKFHYADGGSALGASRGSFVGVSNDGGRNGHYPGLEEPANVRLSSGSSGNGHAGGSRLVRWAASLAAGGREDKKNTDSSNNNAPLHQHDSLATQGHGHTGHPSSGSSQSSGLHGSSSSSGHGGGGGSSSGGGGSGGKNIGGDSIAAASTSDGLFAPASSPLRNRFRTSRRGSKGWSSSTTLAGWGVGTGGSGAGGGSPGAGASLLLGNAFTSRLAMRVIRHLKMAAALAALAIAGLGALLVGCCLYLTVRPWGRATYRRLLCSQLAAPLVDAAALLLPRTRVRVTGDSDMLDGLCPGVIVSNTLPGHAFLGLDWWAILMVARAVGAHGYTKVLVSERLNHTPVLGWVLRILEFPGLGDCYQIDRDRVKECLTSFAKDSTSAGPSGVPYLFLHFPEGDTLNRETLASSLEFAKREGRPELMRVLLPHTTALSGCLDGLRPAKPVVYDVTLAAAGYSGEVPCGRPPSDWEILRALATGRAWDGGGGKPCVKPSCACKPGSTVMAAGQPTSIGSIARGDFSGASMCDDPTCLCRTSALGAAAAPQLMGFSNSLAGDIGGSVSGGGRRLERMGVARSLSVGGVSRTGGSADWTDGAGIGFGSDDNLGGGGEPEGVGRGGERWGRGCQDIHVRIKRYSLEEVVGDTNWLDDRWAEKERLLAYFSRHQNFPSDGRGFPARRTLDTRGSQFEGSAMAFVRLSAVVLFVPLLSLACIPVVIMMGIAALTYRAISGVIRAVAVRTLPRSLTRRIWWGPSEDEDEEDELGKGHSGAQSTLTPWWGGPSTPLNTPAPGAAGAMPFIGGTATTHGGGALSDHDFRSS